MFRSMLQCRLEIRYVATADVTVIKREMMGIFLLPPKSGYWSTAHARIRGLVLDLGLGTVSMHVVSPWNWPFVS